MKRGGGVARLSVTALAALLVAAPGPAAATRGRLALGLLGGAGYTTDAVGAGGGDDAFAQVTPSARLDLALAPAWKMAAQGEATWVGYASSSEPVVSTGGGVELRWLPGGDWQLGLSAGGEYASLGSGAPLDPLLLLAPQVSATGAGTAALSARVRAGGLDWRLLALGTLRSSAALDTGADVQDRELAGVLGVTWARGRAVALGAAYRLERTLSDDPAYTLTSHALVGTADWRMGPLDARFELLLRAATFATGAEEQLARGTLGLVLPLGERVDLEGSYGLTFDGSNDPALPSGTRQLLFFDLRWRVPEVLW